MRKQATTVPANPSGPHYLYWALFPVIPTHWLIESLQQLCDLRALWSQWLSSHGKTDDKVSHRGIAVTFSSNTKMSLTPTVFLIYHLPCKPR